MVIFYCMLSFVVDCRFPVVFHSSVMNFMARVLLAVVVLCACSVFTFVIGCEETNSHHFKDGTFLCQRPVNCSAGRWCLGAGQVVPKSTRTLPTRTQVKSYPFHLVPKSTRTQYHLVPKGLEFGVSL